LIPSLEHTKTKKSHHPPGYRDYKQSPDQAYYEPQQFNTPRNSAITRHGSTTTLSEPCRTQKQNIHPAGYMDSEATPNQQTKDRNASVNMLSSSTVELDLDLDDQIQT
jgi:hypothetical protein